MKIEQSAVQLGSTPATHDKPTGLIRGSRIYDRGTDHVELSRFARAYVTDSAHVEGLKDAYESGAYRIRPDKVAAGIVNYMLAAA